MSPPLLPCSGLTHLFFPAHPYGTPRYDHAVNRARIICITCPHRKACHALARERNEAWGVWAGVDFGGKARDRRFDGTLRKRAG